MGFDCHKDGNGYEWIWIIALFFLFGYGGFGINSRYDECCDYNNDYGGFSWWWIILILAFFWFSGGYGEGNNCCYPKCD